MVLSSLTLPIIKPAFAQSIPKPSVPEFSVKYVDNSYDVPPTYGTDQYTGQTVIKQAGYHVDNRSIELTIKNQPFTPSNDSSGHIIGLYYNFRYKGNYTNDWTYYPEDSNGQSVLHYNGGLGNDEEMYPPIYSASNSDYKVIPLGLSLLGPPVGSQAIPNEANVDFQVQAMIGYFAINNYGYVILTGKLSDWSNTQTVTIGETSNITSPTPAVPEFPILAILPFFVSVLLVAVYFKHRRTNHESY